MLNTLAVPSLVLETQKVATQLWTGLSLTIKIARTILQLRIPNWSDSNLGPIGIQTNITNGIFAH